MTNEQQVAVKQVLNSFDISDDGLRSIKAAIERELELGLRDEEAATIKMLITYVRELSRGDETGTYLALDLGGTNFRVLLVSLDKGHQTQVSSSVHVVPQELLSSPNGHELFDYVALKLLEFVQKKKLNRMRISLGFTFSFPCKQYGLTQSILVKWCKGYNVGQVVGTDVVRQLKDALKRQLSGLVEAYIDVVAVINDTTGTLVACANSNKNCRIGVIVGTGFNACYIESLDKCEKWPSNYTNPKHVIINTEWGAMGDNKQNRELDKFRNEFDSEIDANSVNPSNQTYEKMVSGMYIGEMLRLAMVKLVSKGVLFGGLTKQNATPTQLEREKDSHSEDTSKHSNFHRLNLKNSLNGRHLSMLGEDELSGKLDKTARVLKELNITEYTEADMQIMVRIASRIMQRSAALVACGVSALVDRIGKPMTVIGYDGSVIRYHPYFLSKCKEKCRELIRREYKFEFALSSDGSGIGAAVVAAALHKERRPFYIVKPGKLYEMHFVNNPNSPQQPAQKSCSTTEAETTR